MSRYNLQSDEVMILKQDRITRGGNMAYPNNELILTNLYLVLISKTIFGRVKNTTRFSVEEIKEFNGQAQVFLGKRSNGSPQLEIYLTNGHEYFGFERKIVVRNWVRAINQLVLGHDTAQIKSDSLAIPGTEFIASSIKDTLNTIRDVFGAKESVQVSTKCDSCGASMVGIEGQVVRCRYCSSNQRL